jgi:ABC-type lipoprotein release transport system permease subunit
VGLGTDEGPVGVAAIVLLETVASIIPALRAVRIDPLITLRAE